MDVITIGDPQLFFSSLQRRRCPIAPANLRGEIIPDENIALVQPPALLVAPFQNFFIGPAFEHPLPQVLVINAKEIAHGAVGRLRMAQILMIIRMQFTAGVKPDLVQHSCEIPQTADFLGRAFGEDIHLGEMRDQSGCGGFRQFHRTLELWRILLDSEIVRVKLGDALHIVARERGRFRSLRKFDQLLFVVNVRQG